ncbi:MAG: hypothetical protein Q9179_000205 [Wetmoreana sp. 5 TL-2023]
MSTIQGNLTAVARELDAAQRRADKVKAGKSTANKVAEATSSAEASRREWESQAPYVFEQLQALDESRINHLRDVLTQLQTHEVDQVERNRISAESCLNVLLNVDTAEEVSTFVARVSAGAPTMQQPPIRSRQPSGNMLSTPRSQDDRASEISATSEGHLRRKDDKKTNERPPSPEKRSRPRFGALRRGTSSKNMQAIPSPDEEAMPLPSSPPQPVRSQTVAASPSPPEPRRTNGRVNGDAIQPAPTRLSSLPVANGIPPGNAPDDEEPQMAPPPTAEVAQKQRDTEGFNVAPPALDEISRAQQEAAASEPEPPQFKLDIRSEPIHEEGLDAHSVLSNMANTLRAQAQQIPTPRKPSATRGRRDVRNTVFVPSPQTPDIPGFSEPPVPSQNTFSSGKANSSSSEAPQGSDSHSIRSAHSVSSLAQTPAKHPELTEPGLNASVVETVSAWFSSGQVTKAVVIGELALAHNASEKTSTKSSETIRLENFPVLEKVAPNPAFVTPIVSRSGEYSVNVSQISRTAVAFKYQVHLEEASLGAHAPVIITPSWKIEATQASVIVNYAFNPAFASPTGRSVTLKNVVVVIQLEGSEAQTCQSKPVGNFSKEKSLIYWKLGEVALDGYAEGSQKLLARFGTESEAKPGSVEARWEISGEAAAGLGSGLGLSRSGVSPDAGSSDPFADESTAGSPTGSWKEMKVQRKIMSGKYVAS